MSDKAFEIFADGQSTTVTDDYKTAFMAWAVAIEKIVAAEIDMDNLDAKSTVEMRIKKGDEFVFVRFTSETGKVKCPKSPDPKR